MPPAANPPSTFAKAEMKKLETQNEKLQAEDCDLREQKRWDRPRTRRPMQDVTNHQLCKQFHECTIPLFTTHSWTNHHCKNNNWLGIFQLPSPLCFSNILCLVKSQNNSIHNSCKPIKTFNAKSQHINLSVFSRNSTLCKNIISIFSTDMATLPVYLLTIAYKRGDQYGFYALNKEMQTLECKITGTQQAAMSAKIAPKTFALLKHVDINSRNGNTYLELKSATAKVNDLRWSDYNPNFHQFLINTKYEISNHLSYGMIHEIQWPYYVTNIITNLVYAIFLKELSFLFKTLCNTVIFVGKWSEKLWISGNVDQVFDFIKCQLYSCSQ